MTTERILKVDDLSVRIGIFTIFEHVSFSLHKGETLAVIGPNGGGKTTLLKALLGLVPSSGTIRWEGNPTIGYVPQRFSVDKHFPLLTSEFLEFVAGKPISLPSISPDLIHQRDILKRKVGELSAGELQRVLIAGAISRAPSVLLLDEPTADLDVKGGETISQHIFHLKKEQGLSLIMVSHDLQLVFRWVDRVLCLNRELVCFGSPHEVLTPKYLSELYGGQVAISKHA